MKHRRLPVAAALACSVLVLPGCVFSIGGGSRPVVVRAPAEPGPPLTERDRFQIELAEAYRGEINPSAQRDGLVKVASMPDLTPTARRRVIQMARTLISPSDRTAVLDAVAANPGTQAPAPSPAAEPAGAI